jgi:dienelactone hydrolase
MQLNLSITGDKLVMIKKLSIKKYYSGLNNINFKFYLLIAFIILFLSGCETLDSKKAKYLTFTTHKAKSPSPTVIIAHGCDGAPNAWTEDWRRRLVSWNYNAVVVEQFNKRGFPLGTLCNRGGLIPPEERNIDIAELIDWIKTQKWHKGDVALIGMSHGGAVAIDAAINENVHPKLRASVALYPGCMLVRYNYDNPKIPVQVHLGKQDNWTPCLSSNWSKYESYVYENAGHSFDIDLPKRQYAGHTLWYDKEAAIISQTRIKEFLAKNLK